MGNELIKNIRYLIDCFLEMVYGTEEDCIICKEYVNNQELTLCDSCISMIKSCNSSYNLIIDNHNVICFSGVYYSGIAKELISRLKYKSDFVAGNVLSKYMVEAIKQNKLCFDLITYVPATKNSLKKRGYNQSEFLAKVLGNVTETKVLGLLDKIKETKDQIGLSGEERWNNLKGSYKVKKAEPIIGKRILLVDDVITTGATVFFCAEDMIKNGAKEVYIITAAKSSIG